jgi:hypothetical protein
MTLTAYDRGTYLVESASEPGNVYLVDALEQTCTCDGFLLGGKKCKHLVAVTAWHFGIDTPPTVTAGQRPGRAGAKP